MNTTGDTSTYRRDTVRTRASPSLSRTVDISALDASLTRRVEEFRQLDLGLRQQVHELRDQLVTADRLLRESERSRAWWKNRVQVLDARCREQERAIRQLKLKTAQLEDQHALDLSLRDLPKPKPRTRTVSIQTSLPASTTQSTNISADRERDTAIELLISTLWNVEHTLSSRSCTCHIHLRRLLRKNPITAEVLGGLRHPHHKELKKTRLVRTKREFEAVGKAVEGLVEDNDIMEEELRREWLRPAESGGQAEPGRGRSRDSEDL
ncbi:hypothetical protein G7K_2433-t1 [Saitoella complicata NRRL Y-17804]|uniref:Uncharacterized protein n=1 Tax=Saitoella complicata (strain BCRC 22490 / CBS 7301 / JCM 7358 / NBRC 10748 / NRRL Y-17804) TaxID=698492 RepID=A0A0E9NEL3_SAICN|nr:hypothetical protein G7K_2433-t1 [Saitoella complicata NRRL Y-17804]